MRTVTITISEEGAEVVWNVQCRNRGTLVYGGAFGQIIQKITDVLVKGVSNKGNQCATCDVSDCSVTCPYWHQHTEDPKEPTSDNSKGATE